jgi:hypothetical protein
MSLYPTSIISSADLICITIEYIKPGEVIYLSNNSKYSL